MDKDRKIVEVTVKTDTGEEIPIGIMNAGQAKTLPDDIEVAVAHEDGSPRPDDSGVDSESAGIAAANPVKRAFPEPTTEVEAARFKEARSAVRSSLDDLVAAANEAGWGTEEIVVAILEAAQYLKAANMADPDPADESEVASADEDQAGSGKKQHS